jgi:hypothetical protein
VLRSRPSASTNTVEGVLDRQVHSRGIQIDEAAARSMTNDSKRRLSAPSTGPPPGVSDQSIISSADPCQPGRLPVAATCCQGQCSTVARLDASQRTTERLNPAHEIRENSQPRVAAGVVERRRTIGKPLRLDQDRRAKIGRKGYSPFAPTSHLPGASTSPPPLRSDDYRAHRKPRSLIDTNGIPRAFTAKTPANAGWMPRRLRGRALGGRLRQSFRRPV